MEQLLGQILFIAFHGAFLFCGWLLLRTSRKILSTRKLIDPERFRTSLSLLSVLFLFFGVLFKIAVIAILSSEMRSDDPSPFFVSGWAAGNAILFLVAGVTLWMAKEGIGRQLSIEEYSRQERRANNLRFTGFAFFVWPLTILVLTGLFFMLFPGLLLLFLILIAWRFIRVGKRRSDQGMVLWTLAVSVAKGLPLAEELDVLADGFSGSQRRKFHRVAELLREGMPLAEALERIPGVVPQFAVLAAQVGTENDTLTESLREAAARHALYAQGAKLRSYSPTLVMMYLVVVPIVMMTIVTGIMIWIIPKFKKIFHDFDMEFPFETVAYIETTDFVAQYWYLIIPVPVALYFYLSRKSFCGWGESDIPLVGRWFRRLDLPGVLRHLAHSVRVGKPMEGALAVIGAKHCRKAVRKSLAEVHRKCRQGDDCWYAMRDTGLLTNREVAVLRSSQRVGNLSWALKELAETIERRTSYRWMMILEFAQPAIVLLVGLLVLWTCLAFFMPLVHLLNDLS